MERRCRHRLWRTELAGVRPVRYLCQSAAPNAAGNRPADAAGAASGALRSGHSRRHTASAGVRVNERPAPNPSDTEKLLPPRAVQFEVADLKPSRPGELNASRVFHDRYELRARALGPLIIDAFDIPGSPLYTSDLIVGLPKW